MESNKKEDLNYILIKDRHGKNRIRRFFYRRVITTFFLIAVQIAVVLVFLIKLQPYLEFYFGGSVLLSTFFLIFLSNKQGKNEFKIAWLVPVVLFPLFGVSVYIFFQTNAGGLSLKKRLNNAKKQSKQFIQPQEKTDLVFQNYPQIKDLATYLINAGDYVPYTNNQVRYFAEGEDFFYDFCTSLKNAKRFIFLEYFIIDIDESWELILEILEQKASEGVEVRVMYDALGSIMASTKSYLKYLEMLNIKARVFSPLIPIVVTNQNNRDHRKISVIDGEIAYTGGLNLSNEYFNKGENRFSYWKDNAVRVEGPAVTTYIQLFLQNWSLWKKNENEYESFFKTESKLYDFPGVVIPYGDDAFNDLDVAEDVYLYIINNAKKYINIVTPYFLIDNQMQSALIFAARRGIRINILVPSVPDHLITFCIGKTYLRTLIKNGVNVYLYKKGFVHAKTFISDDKIATVGSINLDYRSLYHHFECGQIMFECPVISDIKKDFEQALKDSEEMKLEDYKKIPSYYRFIGRVLRVFAPLL